MLIKSKKTALLLTSFLSLLGLGAVLMILATSQRHQVLQTQQLLVQEAKAHYNTISKLSTSLLKRKFKNAPFKYKHFTTMSTTLKSFLKQFQK